MITAAAISVTGTMPISAKTPNVKPATPANSSVVTAQLTFEA